MTPGMILSNTFESGKRIQMIDAENNSPHPDIGLMCSVSVETSLSGKVSAPATSGGLAASLVSDKALG